jgi:glycosyltransferase involved in cell wall biosynthesis
MQVDQSRMTDDLVSIMMPAYNAQKYIGAAIDSALAQSYPFWELIIVDDGSTDKTAEIVSRYNDPRIRLIRQANQGEAVARNVALQHSKGVYLAFLDADDLFLPDHLELTVNFLRAHLAYDAVYTDGYHIDEAGNHSLSLSARRRGPFEGWIFPELVRASDVIGPPGCILLRTHPVVAESLKFDPSIVIGPDWDFTIHYAENHHFGYIGQHTYLYRVHQKNITKTVDQSRRTSSLAKCRSNAIKLQKFNRCSPEIRYKVFYDLLILLLPGAPERQSAVIEWQEFQDLSQKMQAKLLRLMASKAILIGGDATYIKGWLKTSLKKNQSDWRTPLLQVTYQISPGFSRKVLISKGSFPEEEAPLSTIG